MMNIKPRVAGAGICCLDHIMVAPQTPYGGSAHASDYYVQGGGLAATAIVACARLGAKCSLFSILGDDQVGDRLISELGTEGVATSHIARLKGVKSPISLVHVDEFSGERTIFHYRDPGLEWNGEPGDFSAIERCGALLVDHCYPKLAISAARCAREHGVPVVSDVLPHRSPELVSYIDIMILPRHFAVSIGCENDLDRALDEVHKLGPGTAVITLGAEGWVYSNASGRGRGRAFDVDVVDTTGAGDVFHGAFAYGVARGWDTAKCGEFAAAAAAIKCTRRGGRTGIPSLEQTLEFLRQRGSLEWNGP
ncbi:MAG: PfkB family carbohydrate kinase [Armatimonadetes bacterium]|nr:PfkB family carbohydrate kinase [Armatimonadota bacterium]